MAKRYWKSDPAYKRILEILDDYWLTEKDEEYVEVTMYFRHADGHEQEKVIRWHNPNHPTKDSGNICDSFYTLAEVQEENP